MFATISEKTKIPINLVLLVVAITVAFVRLEGKVNAQADQITDLQRAYLEQSKTISRIDKTTIRIAAKMNIEVPINDGSQQ